MWKSLPIQTESDRGDDGARILSHNPMVHDPAVTISLWKDVPPEIRQWCLSIWSDAFGTVRTPLDHTDLLGWVPRKGTIVGKVGRWIGESRSRPVGYVSCLWVDELHRKEGLARALIHSIAAEGCKQWGESSAFLFEVDTIPRSLADRGAVPVCRYSYTWVPFTSIQRPPKWIPTTFEALATVKGFHSLHYTGWKAFKYGEDVIVLDSSNDIVWYSSWISLSTFDGLPLPGAYCRVFSPFGPSAVYAQNMYATPFSIGAHVLLG